MKKHILFYILFLLFYIDINAQSNYDFVNDAGNFFSEDEEQSLREKLKEYRDKTTVEITIRTIETLEANIQKEYSLKEKDILIFIVKRERKTRIDFGFSIQKYISKERSDLILAEQMIPNFKQGNFYKGVYLAIDKIFELLGDKFND